MGIGPSIEDLLPSHKGQADEDASTEQELQSKIKQITLKDIEEETENKAALLGIGYVNLVGFQISPESIRTLDEATSQKHKVICYLNDGATIKIATTDYNQNIKNLAKELSDKLHAQVSISLMSENSFQSAYKLYQILPKLREFKSGLDIKQADLDRFEKEIADFTTLNQTIQKTSITDMVTLLIAAAIKARSSDIHIEAEEKDVKIRYRIDGVLNDAAILNKEIWPKVASRMKQLAQLKINITDRPQDGRFTIYLDQGKVDVRVSALPTAFGESIVMRLLMSTAVGLAFEDLGLRGQAFKVLQREISRPNGMIITTGPTGSGKTTTLYSILRKLNNPETKIITIEDPIEYELEGINQSQVNKDYTFAKGLRSIVRQDPDIIMVGEIRDLETAEIAIQAALTGHLVLSTIHTNDAFGTIPRFLSMGVKPFLLAPALNVAIGQRLVRRICDHCKQEVELESELLERAKNLLAKIPAASGEQVDINNLKFYAGQGCDKCQGLTFKGRIGIYEIMPIDDDVKQKINSDISEVEVKKIAHDKGVITMAQDGLLKALDGITTVEEVFRVAE